MSDEAFDEGMPRATHVGSDEPLTPERIAEAIGARPALVLRLVRLGVLEPVHAAAGETLLPPNSVLHIRQMLRLRRDLGVNFAGASIILELVAQIEELKRTHRAPKSEGDAEE